MEFTRDFTGLGSPPILFLLGVLVFGWSSSLLLLIVAWLVNETICSAYKYYFFTERPEPMKWSTWYEKIEAGSMPSIHSSRWSTFAGFSLFHGVHSNIFLVLCVMAVGVAASRVILRKHYVLDVVVGLVVGFLVGFLFTIG